MWEFERGFLYQIYTRNYNAKINAVLLKVQERYPEVSEGELMEILNSPDADEDSFVKKYGIVINDLYGLMQDKPLDYHSDVAHFYTKKAATLITEKVCSVIDAALEIKANRPNYDFWFDETESYEGGAWLAKRASEGNSTETLGI